MEDLKKYMYILLNHFSVHLKLIQYYKSSICFCCCSVAKSCLHDSWWHHGLQHARPPCSSPSPIVCESSCPLNQWCHPTISSSATHFSCCLQSFPASGLFQWVSSLHQVTKVLVASASASVLPMNIQDGFPLGLTGLISLQSKGLSRVFSRTTVWKHRFFDLQPSLWSNSHICTCLLERP